MPFRFFCILGFLLSGTALTALEPGGRYDFICLDGQDIYNAELVSENAERYFVRLSPVLHSFPIDKSFVVRTVERSVPLKNPPPKVEHKSEISVSAGMDFSTGRLATFSKIAPALSIAGAYAVFSRFDAIARIDANQFVSSESSLRSAIFTAGARYRLPYVFWNIESAAGLAAGATLLIARSATLSETGAAFTLTAFGRLTRDISGHFGVMADMHLHYIYDRETVILLPGISLGGIYRF